ncbi:MAG: ribonuclease D, partial [Synechococcaceae cyanobacterium]|nr:ribonuclease D [Synechococcaceae cyanobacterium]
MAPADPTSAGESRSSCLPPPARFAVFDRDLDADWQALYGSVRALAIDTEAMGLVHGRDRLCLVQICDDHDHVACIRLQPGQAGAPRLKELLEDPGIEKVFHFARFDVA